MWHSLTCTASRAGKLLGMTGDTGRTGETYWVLVHGWGWCRTGDDVPDRDGEQGSSPKLSVKLRLRIIKTLVPEEHEFRRRLAEVVDVVHMSSPRRSYVAPAPWAAWLGSPHGIYETGCRERQLHVVSLINHAKSAICLLTKEMALHKVVYPYERVWVVWEVN